MSLRYDYTKCKKPENKNEQVAIDCLIWATMGVGLSEITEQNAAEFYARLALLEKVHGAYRVDPQPEGPKPVYFTAEEVRRWIGLNTNAGRMSRARFLSGFNHELDSLAKQFNG